MNKARQQLLAKIIKEEQLQKLAQDSIAAVEEGTTQEGERAAEHIFDQLLNKIMNEFDSES